MAARRAALWPTLPKVQHIVAVTTLAWYIAGYSSELNRLLSGSLDLEDLVHAELVMVAQFQTPGSRTWREGNIKSCFNYLLLDPRVTKNLPLRAKSLSKYRSSYVVDSKKNTD